MKKLDLERMLIMSQQQPVVGARIKAAPLLEDWFQTSGLDVDRYLRSEAEAQMAAQQEQAQATSLSRMVEAAGHCGILAGQVYN
jgi:hypothetical protein